MVKYIPPKPYRLLESAEEISPYCKEGEVPGILPSEEKAGGLGFANYVRHDDWRNATRRDATYWRVWLNSLLGTKLLRTKPEVLSELDIESIERRLPSTFLLEAVPPKLPIERVYVRYVFDTAGSGYGPFLLESQLRYAKPEEVKRLLTPFLDEIVKLFPTRQGEGLVFRVLELPSENIVYGVIPSQTTIKREAA
ncbi:hypothetical protein J4448_03495 [Candidatus Woesearchaeota archaeon]|nr:hypothetical protein [Candidatus Woesearchaeota archaeon]